MVWYELDWFGQPSNVVALIDRISRAGKKAGWLGKAGQGKARQGRSGKEMDGGDGRTDRQTYFGKYVS